MSPVLRESLRRIPPFTTLDSLHSWAESCRKQADEAARGADLVHVANTGFAGWIGRDLADRHRLPLVLTEHALYWKEVEMGAVALECGYRIPDRDSDRRDVVTLFREIARRVYESSEVVISVSRSNMHEQRRLGASHTRYLPNGVEAGWLKENKRNGDRLTLGWIGRCAEMKNPMRFLELASQIGTGTDYCMMLCDAGEPGLKQRVIERAGTIPNLEMIWNRPTLEHIDRMDAICITSHNESQPLVLFEALARMVLPFGWAVGDVDERFAVTVPAKSGVDAMASAIRDLWDAPPRWRQELEQRHERIATWDTVFKKYREIFETIVRQ